VSTQLTFSHSKRWLAWREERITAALGHTLGMNILNCKIQREEGERSWLVASKVAKRYKGAQEVQTPMQMVL
jgi:hypothetical protein